MHAPRPADPTALPPTTPDRTVEEWAEAYVASATWADKLDPPPIPRRWATPRPSPRRLEAPGRGDIAVATSSPRTRKPGALRSVARRAELMHTFLHHELQAAELMAWALLAFPEAPPAFRRGLVGVLTDEIRHMRMYRDYLRELGVDAGAYPVRDWFWERVPAAPTARHFVAVMGVGFEGGNLDHAARFADRLRAVGDLRGAELVERVGEEEVPHVRFALRWFAALGPGGAGDPTEIDFHTWSDHLPAPLSPMLMQGRPIDVGARVRAGFPRPFVEDLARWAPGAPGT